VTGGQRLAGDVPAGRSPAHGFGDDEETRRLLRSRPPRQALTWAAACLGGPVISARALRGGMSSAVHLLTIQDSPGLRRQAVLRRYVRPESREQEPDAAWREARALRVAEAVGVPTPALLAVDPAGAEAGEPAILMSRLPGRVDWWPSNLDRWLARLAEVPARIHAAPLPTPGELRPFAPYRQASYRPPGWARYPRVWERAAEITHGPQPRLPAVLLHRDFHPGNVLWRRGTVTGVVDWQAACTGPAVADVAHCRVNLLTIGTGAAERFTALWQRAAGAAYHPWADVVTIIGFLDDLRDDWGSERQMIEDVLVRAVAELGRTAPDLRPRLPVAPARSLLHAVLAPGATALVMWRDRRRRPDDGMPDFLVFRGGQHEASQLQDFVRGEVVGDGYRAYPWTLDSDNRWKGGHADNPHLVLLPRPGRRMGTPLQT
jgi:aminoglycoside phosphotransferase (APT) family kinase protein